MRVNADSLLIRAAATSTSGTLNDLTTDLIMANNNNNYDVSVNNGILLNVVLMVRKFYKHDKIIDITFTFLVCILIEVYHCIYITGGINKLL